MIRFDAMRSRVTAATWLTAGLTFGAFAVGFWLSGITSPTRAILCGVSALLTALTIGASVREYYIGVGHELAAAEMTRGPATESSTAPTVVEDPKPNLTPVLAHLTRVHLNHSSHLLTYGDGTRFDTPYLAAVVPFRNEVDPGRRTGDAFDIRARVAMGSELYPVTGYWLDSESDRIHLPAGASAKDLVVAIRDRNGSIFLVDDQRSDENYRLPGLLQYWQVGMPEESFRVAIRLVADGILLGEFKYEIATKMFDIRE